MDAFYAKIDDPEHHGAIFFAVCRGKVCVCVCARARACVCVLRLKRISEFLGHSFEINYPDQSDCVSSSFGINFAH